MNNNLANLIREAGLTEGESKVYLALLKLDSSTSGPIIEESGVANSIIYRILDSLIEKGLVSYIIKEKTKYFKAAEPKKILDYLEEKKDKIEESKENIEKMIPQLLAFASSKDETTVQVYEEYKGVQTCFGHYLLKLKKGEGYYCWGVYPIQEDKYHTYWQRGHIERGKKGIFAKMLFNQGTDPEILRNRNSYKLCDTRYMPTNIKTPAWFLNYKDTTAIFLHIPGKKQLQLKLLIRILQIRLKLILMTCGIRVNPLNETL